MASTQLLISLFLLFSLLLISANPSLSFSDTDSAEAPSLTDKVDLALYYEALCPYCQTFIKDQLVKVFSTDLNTIVKLKMVPFGNAKVLPNKTVECQHGKDECHLNAIDACAISIWPETRKHFSFIRCVESNERYNTAESETIWTACAQKMHLAPKPIKDCYGSEVAEKLILQYGDETARLTPPHEFVPWVTVNDRPLYDGYDKFMAEVCTAYKGKAVPKACQSAPSSDSPEVKQSRKACYLGEARNTISGLR